MTPAAQMLPFPERPTPPDYLSAHFHQVNRLLPEDQSVLSVPPDTSARAALRIMKTHGYSQLPVVEGNQVLGVFSYRAFALEALEGENSGSDLADLPVEEFLSHEDACYARLSDEFRGLISVLDQRDSVLVAGPDNLIGLLTPMDVLRYLYEVASAFVLVEEIELALRALIRRALGEGELFQACLRQSLAHNYEATHRKLPEVLEDLTFDEELSLVRDGRSWEYFQPVFGGTRERANAKLKPIGRLRNDLFHFRRELAAEEHQQLTYCRDWLLRCVRKIQAREGAADER